MALTAEKRSLFTESSKTAKLHELGCYRGPGLLVTTATAPDTNRAANDILEIVRNGIVNGLPNTAIVPAVL